MTTGQVLKKNLKLLNFPYAKIRRLVTGGSLVIYQVVFDSRIAQRPLTSYLLNTTILAPRILNYEGNKFSALPWVTLDVFNASLNPSSIFCVIDLAGFYGNKSNYSEKTFKFEDNKLEELTIPQLRNVDMYTSNLTQKYKDQRKDFQGQGIKNTKLIDSVVIVETGSLRFTFITEATEIDKKKLSHNTTSSKIDKKLQYDTSSGELIDNPSKTYDLYLQLDNVFPNTYFKDISWLETYNGEEINSKMMKDLLDVADAKLYSNDPSFQFQGFRYRLSQLDSSIFPETIPDTFWRKKHGNNGYLTKHFSQLLDAGTIQVFLNNMESMLIKQCKSLGYAKNVGKNKKLVINIEESTMKVLKEKAPEALKGIADDTGKTESEVKNLWDKEVKALGKSEDSLTGEDYGILIGKVKDAAGVKGKVDSDTYGKNTNESVYTVSEFLESKKSAKDYLK